MKLPSQARALQTFVAETGRWPSRTAPYAAMPWPDGPHRPRKRTERRWLDFSERELALWLQNQRQHASDNRRRLLDEHVPGWDEHIAGIDRASFDVRLEELRGELAEIAVGSRGELSEGARGWLRKQRTRHVSMPARERAALDETYPDWRLPQRRQTLDEARFDARIEDLATFRERTGAWPSTRSPLKAERSLAVWVRDARCNASPDRRARLTAAVPGWDVPRQPGGKGNVDEVTAARRLKELRQFIADNGRAPSRKAEPGTTEGSLAAWVHGHLMWDHRRREQILEILGNHYQPRTERWSTQLRKLEGFVSANGRLPRHTRSAESALYSWMYRQRTCATEEQAAQLDRTVPGWRGQRSDSTSPPTWHRSAA